MTEAAVMVARLHELARLVGMLRRRFASNADAWTGGYLADQAAGHIEVLHGMLVPTAAERYRTNYLVCCDEHLALAEALADTDRQVRQLHALLQEPER